MKSVVNSSVDVTLCSYAESDVGGAAVRSRMDGSVSGDQGLNTVVRNMDIGMNRLEQYE